MISCGKKAPLGPGSLIGPLVVVALGGGWGFGGIPPGVSCPRPHRNTGSVLVSGSGSYRGPGVLPVRAGAGTPSTQGGPPVVEGPLS